jgi:serine/threonine-protein kinase
VAWEVFTGRRLFDGEDPATVVSAVISGAVRAPSSLRSELPATLDAIVLRGLALDRENRFASAREMALALEAAIRPASPASIGDWVRDLLGEALLARSKRIAEIESETRRVGPLGVPVIDEVRERAEAATALIDTSSAKAASQLTDLPATKAGFLARRPSSSRTVSMVTALLMAGAAGVWLGSARLRPKPSAEQRTGTVAEIASASIDFQPTTSHSIGAVIPSSSSSPAAAASSPPAPPPRKSVTPRPVARPSDCNPPYTYDSLRKIRVFKEHCVRK